MVFSNVTLMVSISVFKVHMALGNLGLIQLVLGVDRPQALPSKASTHHDDFRGKCFVGPIEPIGPLYFVRITFRLVILKLSVFSGLKVIPTSR